jgi:hypothetical protein
MREIGVVLQVVHLVAEWLGPPLVERVEQVGLLFFVVRPCEFFPLLLPQVSHVVLWILHPLVLVLLAMEYVILIQGHYSLYRLVGGACDVDRLDLLKVLVGGDDLHELYKVVCIDLQDTWKGLLGADVHLVLAPGFFDTLSVMLPFLHCAVGGKFHIPLDRVGSLWGLSVVGQKYRIM